MCTAAGWLYKSQFFHSTSLYYSIFNYIIAISTFLLTLIQMLIFNHLSKLPFNLNNHLISFLNKKIIVKFIAGSFS